MSGNINIADARTNGPVPSRGMTAITSRGLLSETYPLAGLNGANAAVTSQQPVCSLLGLAAGDIVTNLIPCITVAGVLAAPTLIKLALIAKDGTVLATTANSATDAKWQATGLPEFPLSTPYTVTADDGYYVAMLENGAFATPVQLLRLGGNPGAQAVRVGGRSVARTFAVGAAGQTDIAVGSAQVLTDPGSGVSFWFGVS